MNSQEHHYIYVWVQISIQLIPPNFNWYLNLPLLWPKLGGAHPLPTSSLCISVPTQSQDLSLLQFFWKVVGGLLSAHLLSVRAGFQLDERWPCEGPLLRLAVNVAERLLPGSLNWLRFPNTTTELSAVGAAFGDVWRHLMIMIHCFSKSLFWSFSGKG